MLPKSNTNTVCHKWRHSVFSVGDMEKPVCLKLISIKFATFWSLNQLIWSIFRHFMAILTHRFETEFPRILEKPLGINGLTGNPKSTFFEKTCRKCTFRPFFVRKPSNLRKNWILKIQLNPLVPTGIIWGHQNRVAFVTSSDVIASFLLEIWKNRFAQKWSA